MVAGLTTSCSTTKGFGKETGGFFREKSVGHPTLFESNKSLLGNCGITRIIPRDAWMYRKRKSPL